MRSTKTAIEPIYRDVELSKLSKDNCTKFLQGLSISNGKITSHFQLTNGFSDKDVMRREMFFRVEFQTLEDADKFCSLGLETKVPEAIGADPLWALGEQPEEQTQDQNG